MSLERHTGVGDALPPMHGDQVHLGHRLASRTAKRLPNSTCVLDKVLDMYLILNCIYIELKICIHTLYIA